MKKLLFKRIIALILVLVLSFSIVACSGKGDGDKKDEKKEEKQQATKPVDTDVLESDDLSYVMIYNPNIYDELSYANSDMLSTGKFGTQIDAESNRADDLEEDAAEVEYYSVSQDYFEPVPEEELNLDGDRAEAMGVDHELGERYEFYTQPYNIGERPKIEMECVYVGEYCYIWTDGVFDENTLVQVGEVFDEKIYSQTVEEFGEPRFVGESGKVNLLFYSFDSEFYNWYGFFCIKDLHANDELRNPDEYNTNHAIIHFNANSKSLTSGNIAHELQHLINYSNVLKSYGCVHCNTWINEVMSGYIEEIIYPGTKELVGHYIAFNGSNRIRSGQSLYNFDNDYKDIGVYGSVFYFSEYLRNLAGDTVFNSFSNYWANSYSDTLSVAEALKNSVSSSVANKVDSIIDYGNKVDFDNADEEWMSKLTLDFYLTMLSKDTDNEYFKKIRHNRLLFADVEGAEIEGGGRVIVPVNGKFEIPDDAESGLVYIGLDKDFNPVTDFVLK